MTKTKLFVLLFLLISTIVYSQSNPTVTTVNYTFITTANTWGSFGIINGIKSISILENKVGTGHTVKLALKNNDGNADSVTGFYPIKKYDYFSLDNRISNVVYYWSATTGDTVTIKVELTTGNTYRKYGLNESQVRDMITLSNDTNTYGKVFSDNIFFSLNTFQKLMKVRSDSVWGSGYKKALMLYGVAPSLVFWDSVNNKAAGFAYDNGNLRGYIGSSLSAVGTKWFDVTTGGLFLPLTSTVLGAGTFTGGSPSIQFGVDAVPNTNGSQALGTSSLTWAEAYVNGFTTKIDSTASNTTMDYSSNTLLVYTGASDVTITLNNGASYKDGREFKVKKLDDGAGRVIVQTSSAGFIDGTATDYILSMNESKTYRKKGSNYYIIY